jgi:polyferredoxin
MESAARRPARHARRVVQIVWAAATNAWLPGYAQGTVYSGGLKAVCVPGLNCYACPGAFGSCPIGAVQAVAGSAYFNIPFYLIGFFLIVGGALGRFVCGFLCPFGLVQEGLHRIPFVKKIGAFPADRRLRYIKYIVLAVLVVILPMTVVNAAGGGEPWFCKWLCPAGTLEGGIPLLAASSALRGAAGALLAWKASLLAAAVLFSILMYRPFCRYLCPLGAVYALFNRYALLRYAVREGACTGCGACAGSCPMNLDPKTEPNHAECVRCGRCKAGCPSSAIITTLAGSPIRGRSREAGQAS